MKSEHFIELAAHTDKYVVDFLHLSPPCQPFAAANTSQTDDSANLSAFDTVGDLVKHCKPRVATVEEVGSLTRPDHREDFRQLIWSFILNGYSLQWKVLKLWQFGVPQSRVRLIMIASGPGENLPRYVQPTHCNQKPLVNGFQAGLDPFPTTAQAISASPPGTPNHDLQRRFFDPPGKTPRDPNWLLGTVVCERKSEDHYHPTGSRGYTIREYARLQTFPDDFVFVGNLGDQLRQIGNDVPPKFAEMLYRHLKKELLAADEKEMCPKMAVPQKYSYEAGLLQAAFETYQAGLLQVSFEALNLASSGEGESEGEL